MTTSFAHTARSSRLAVAIRRGRQGTDEPALRRFVACVLRGPMGEGRPGPFALRQRVNVFDEAPLWGFALARYRAEAGGHSMAEGIGRADLEIAHAVLHALVFSSDNPDPHAPGVAFINGRARVAAGQPRFYSTVAALLALEAPSIGDLVWGWPFFRPLVPHWITVAPPGPTCAGSAGMSRSRSPSTSSAAPPYLVSGEGAYTTAADTLGALVATGQLFGQAARLSEEDQEGVKDQSSPAPGSTQRYAGEEQAIERERRAGL